MLSRTLRRALLDPRWRIPPPFLLPWAAGLSTTTLAPESAPLSSRISTSENNQTLVPSQKPHVEVPSLSRSSAPLSPSVRSLLPLLSSQAPHYITAHIHGRPYLLTEGDIVRLPFFMHDVSPGDVIRLNRAVNLGSRDYTLKARAAEPILRSPTMDSSNIITSDVDMSHSSLENATATDGSSTVIAKGAVPHFIPHIAQGKHAYLDDRLFVCRAVVLGADSEPLRIKEKTKRRQRHVRRIKSKHRFTLLRVKELRVRSLEEFESLASSEEVN